MVIRWRSLLAPLIALETLASKLLPILRRSALVQLLGLGGVATLVALSTWVWNAPDRKREKHFKLWQVIHTAEAGGASGGRKEALEELADEGVSLAKVDLSGAWLPSVRLKRAQLMYARIDSALLEDADLAGASLRNASARGANLNRALLREAILDDADFRGSTLNRARLERVSAKRSSFTNSSLSFALLDSSDFYLSAFDSTDLEGADLHSAQLSGANMQGASLRTAELGDARLAGADLRGADLAGIRNWRDIHCLDGANIAGVRNPPSGFIEWAKSRRASMEASDTVWSAAKRALITRAAMRSQPVAGGGLSFPLPKGAVLSQYRIPVSIDDSTNAFAWFTATRQGTPDQLFFMIRADIIADCLPPYPVCENCALPR